MSYVPDPGQRSVMDNVSCEDERNVCPAGVGWSGRPMAIISCWLKVLLSSAYPYWLPTCWVCPALREARLPTVMVDSGISPSSSLSFLLMHLTLRVVCLLGELILSSICVPLLIQNDFHSLKICCVWNKWSSLSVLFPVSLRHHWGTKLFQPRACSTTSWLGHKDPRCPLQQLQEDWTWQRGRNYQQLSWNVPG